MLAFSAPVTKLGVMVPPRARARRPAGCLPGSLLPRAPASPLPPPSGPRSLRTLSVHRAVAAPRAGFPAGGSALHSCWAWTQSCPQAASQES